MDEAAICLHTGSRDVDECDVFESHVIRIAMDVDTSLIEGSVYRKPLDYDILVPGDGQCVCSVVRVGTSDPSRPIDSAVPNVDRLCIVWRGSAASSLVHGGDRIVDLEA